jgi:amidase
MNWNAFIPDGKFIIEGKSGGRLSGLTASVKDLFDIAGYPTGAGNPQWLKSHAVPHEHAEVVRLMLDAGVKVIGKTITEELAYSLVGENVHYGTPVNPHNLECIPGGSSSGAAVSAAAGLCDFALCTDTAGSVRLPASFCGVWGLRPSHGVLSVQGVVPLAPSFDTPGWVSKSPEVMLQVGEALLPPDQYELDSKSFTLAFPEDLWSRARPEFDDVLKPIYQIISSFFSSMGSTNLSSNKLLDWQNAFRMVQGFEAWQSHGDWVKSVQPNFGPGIKERFQWASTISENEAIDAKNAMLNHAQKIYDYLNHSVICMPTVSYLAPKKGEASSEQDRTNALCLLSLASMAGVPQISMPLATIDGKALGLSLMSQRYTDRQLLKLSQNISKLLN